MDFHAAMRDQSESTTVDHRSFDRGFDSSSAWNYESFLIGLYYRFLSS
jgi:hypothetical protein